MTPGEVGKLLGEKWKALTDKQKTPYEAKAAADKKRYEEEKAAYTAVSSTDRRLPYQLVIADSKPRAASTTTRTTSRASVRGSMRCCCFTTNSPSTGRRVLWDSVVVVRRFFL